MDIFKKLKKEKTAFIILIILGILVFLALVGNTILGIDPLRQIQRYDCWHREWDIFSERTTLAEMFWPELFTVFVFHWQLVLFRWLCLNCRNGHGTISGYVGGKVDSVLVLIIEVVCAFPTVLLGLLLATVLGSGMTNIMLAIGISNVPYFARLARSMAISIRGREYIESAVTTGLNHFEIITRYVLPK